MDHLIADSGIHFITSELEFNPNEPLVLPSGKVLKYSFVETVDFLEGFRVFNLLYYHNGINKYIPLDELQNSDDALLRRPNGREELDESGMIQMDPQIAPTLYSTYGPGDPAIYDITSLISYRVTNPLDGHSKVPAFELLLGKWLPMPMFRKEIDGVTSNTPLAWCRMKMEKIGAGQKAGYERYRLVWAFDTQMGEDVWSMLRPYISDEDNGVCEYAMCNKVDLLFDFLSSGEEFHAFSDYIASLLGIDIDKEESSKYKALRPMLSTCSVLICAPALAGTSINNIIIYSK